MAPRLGLFFVITPCLTSVHFIKPALLGSLTCAGYYSMLDTNDIWP